MSFFDRVSQALSGKKAPGAPDLRRLVDAAGGEVEAAERRLADLKARRAETIATGGEAGRIELRAAIATAEADLDDAREAQALLQTRLAEKVEADEQGRRLRAYEAAQRLRDETAKRVAVEYPRYAAGLIALIEAAALADAAVAEANSQLPEGFSELLSTEWSARLGGFQPQRIVDDRTVTLWRAPGSDQPLPPEMQGKVEIEPGRGRGFIRRATTFAPPDDPSAIVQRRETHFATSYFEQAEFRRTEIIEGQSGDVPPLLRELDLPALKGGEPPYWRALPVWTDPDHVLRELAAREAERAETAPQPEPRRRVTFTLVSDEQVAAE